jgi:hypothetical protein
MNTDKTCYFADEENQIATNGTRYWCVKCHDEKQKSWKLACRLGEVILKINQRRKEEIAND